MASKPLIQHFVDDINKAIDKYRDLGLTIGELMGVFTLAQFDMWAEWNGASMYQDDDLPSGDPNIFSGFGGS